MKLLSLRTLVLLFAVLVPALSRADEPEQSFDTWLAAFKAEALGKGISQATLDSAFTDVRTIDRVVELDRKQPEFTLTFQWYMGSVVSDRRIVDGKAALKRQRALLKAVSAKYGVPPAQIVALWGIESNFGRSTGTFPVVAALATLAYDGRRSQYFRGELMRALEMVQGGVPAERMRGSWAGAMGQCQFMPSTFRKYAVHWGEGTATAAPDIWGSEADVFASAANYLASIGWKKDERWGREVKLPARGIGDSLLGLDKTHSVTEWNKLGVRQANGKPLPSSNVRASLVRAADGPAYLVYDNFKVIMQWNRSTLFGVAAGTLADRIASR